MDGSSSYLHVKVGVFLVLFCWGVLSGVGHSLNIEWVGYSPILSNFTALLLSAFAAYQIAKKGKNPMLVSFWLSFAGISCAIVLLLLRLFTNERDALYEVSVLPVLLSAFYQGFAVPSIFYANELIQ